MTDQIKLLGISNAIVDVLSHVDGEFLRKIGAPPGSMTLIDEDRAHEIYDMMGPATEMSGGSVANTVAGFANLGGAAAYIGRVNDDQLGEIFVHDMRSLGVNVRLTPAPAKAPTARCHVLISADGQPFYDPEADAALFSAIKEDLAENVELIELDAEINDPEFSTACAEALLRNLERGQDQASNHP